MRKKMIAALLSVMVCSAMIGSTVFAATTSDLSGSSNGSSIDGDSTLVEPIYKITVPTALTFGVDAFEQNGRSQIYSVDYPIINKSNVNVKVDVKLEVAPKSGVTINFKDSADDVGNTGTDKDVWFAAAVPTEVTETADGAASYTKPIFKVTSTSITDGIYVEVAAGEGDAEAKTAAETIDATGFAAGENPVATEVKTTNTTGVTGTFNYTTGNFATTTLKDTAETLTFALEKATYLEFHTQADLNKTEKVYQAVAATDQKGTATFRFMGKVNDAATWTDKDLHAKATYTFIGLSDANYATATTGDSRVAVGSDFAHALVKTAPANVAPSSTQNGQTISFSKATGVVIDIDLGSGNLKATNVKSIFTGPAADSVTTTFAGTSNFADGKLTLTGSGWTSAPVAATKYLKIVMDDDAQTTFTYTVTIAN